MLQPQKTESARILLIDDSEIVLEVVRTTLEEAGYTVETLTSPLTLPSAVRRFKPDLIMLDLNMPALSGKTAFEIASRQEASRNVPVVFHSDRPESELQQVVTSTGAAGFIQKTSDASKLVNEVQSWLRRTR